MAARHFSLGDAILHTANTSAHVPDAWRLALLRQLDSHSCAAVAQTCKAGLNCLLQEREDATLRVTGRKPKELPAHSLLRWTQAARGQLALRGSKATTLELTQCGSLRREDTWWQTVLGHLCAGPITHLSLRLQYIAPALLEYAGQALPGLTTLTVASFFVIDCEAQLPPPTAMPALRHLTIDWVSPDAQGSLWPTVAHYLQQLTSLTIPEQPEESENSVGRPMFFSIFNPLRPSKSLTRLALPISLTPGLATLLVQALPELGDLTVDKTDGHIPGPPMAVSCPWTVLKCKSDFAPACFAWLPLPAEGTRLTVEVQGRDGHVCIDLEAVQQVIDKVPAVQLKGCKILSLISFGSADIQPTKLRSVLSALGAWQSAHTELSLFAVTINDAVVTELSAAMASQQWLGLSIQLRVDQLLTTLTKPFPALHKLSLSGTLTDAHIAQLQRVVTSAKLLHCVGVRLVSVVPEGTRLSWGSLCSNMSVTALVEQARLLRTSTVWVLHRLSITMTEQQVNSASFSTLMQQLTEVTIKEIDTVCISMDEGMSAPAQPHVLRASLELCRALPTHARELWLEGWPATEAIVAELRGLPHWQGTLVLRLLSYKPNGKLDVPLPVSRAPWYIPSSYSTWQVYAGNGRFLTDDDFKALCYNAPPSRTPANPLSILYMARNEPAWVDSIAEYLTESGAYPCVTVTAPGSD